MSKDSICIICIILLIVSGAICGFQIVDVPPSVPSWMAFVTNPFGILSIICLIIIWFINMKNDE